MLFKSRGIVLHTTKYGDSSLIITLYTENYGRKSCIINATGGIRSRNKTAILQPLFIVEMEIVQHKSGEIQRIKESRLVEPYLTIPYDVKKSSQAIFLAELLFKILQEEESNPPLYTFIENSLIYFDMMKEGSVNFHLWFIARLTEFLGILPHLGEVENGWFDMKKGIVTDRVPVHPFFMDRETTGFLKTILTLDISSLPGFKMNHQQRNLLLINLLDYLHLHFDNLGNIKSLAVLKAVFE